MVFCIISLVIDGFILSLPQISCIYSLLSCSLNNHTHNKLVNLLMEGHGLIDSGRIRKWDRREVNKHLA